MECQEMLYKTKFFKQNDISYKTGSATEKFRSLEALNSRASVPLLSQTSQPVYPKFLEFLDFSKQLFISLEFRGIGALP